MKHTVRSTKCWIRHMQCCRGFTLVEMVTALGILALVCSSVLVVIDRCVTSATDSSMQMKAFEVAHENMEKLLASSSVELSTEFGISEKFPDVKWQNVVEEFYEPITKRMWIRGTCSVEYTDTKGEVQMVELTHWLTNVTKQQILQIIEEKRKKEESEDGEPEEPEEPDEPDEPDDPNEPDDPDEPDEPDEERTWCGMTWEEIMGWELDKVWNWDCPEFWDYLINEYMKD